MHVSCHCGYFRYHSFDEQWVYSRLSGGVKMELSICEVNYCLRDGQSISRARRCLWLKEPIYVWLGRSVAACSQLRQTVNSFISIPLDASMDTGLTDRRSQIDKKTAVIVNVRWCGLIVFVAKWDALAAGFDDVGMNMQWGKLFSRAVCFHTSKVHGMMKLFLCD